MGEFDRHADETSVKSLVCAVPPPLLVGVLSPDECFSYLASSHIGRIAVSIAALPVILPVNYLAIDGAVWFRAPSEDPLLRASIGSVVAFEADGCDEVGSFGWSVLVRGIANEVTDPAKLETVKSSFVEGGQLVERADRYVVVPATMLTGERHLRAA